MKITKVDDEKFEVEEDPVIVTRLVEISKLKEFYQDLLNQRTNIDIEIKKTEVLIQAAKDVGVETDIVVVKT